MTKKLNSFMLTDELITLMKDLQISSRESGNEIGFNFCANKTNNIIKMPECAIKGNCHSVTIPKGCPEGYQEVGDFHTHPGEYDEFGLSGSAKDFKYTCGHIADCIGMVNNVKCFVRKKSIDSYSCKKEFEEFANLVEIPLREFGQDLKDKYPEIVKLEEKFNLLSKQKRTMEIDIEQRQIEGKIDRYSRSVKYHDREIDKYTSKIKELRERYFDEVEL